MVNVPDPEQPAPVPVSVQLPVIALLVRVPSRVSWLVPLVFDEPDWIVIWNVPVVIPPVVPVTVKLPVAVVPNAKHEDVVVKLRLVTFKPPPLCARVTVKARAGVPFELVSVAVQFPLMVLLLELFPQAANAITIKSMIAMLKCFTESSTK
jgi:hypothetical protein